MSEAQLALSKTRSPLAAWPPAFSRRRIALVLLVVALAGGLYIAPQKMTLGLAAAGLALPLAWLVIARPEVGLLGLVFLTSSFMRVDAVDFRFSFGGLDLRDMVLMGLIGILAFQGVVRKKLVIPWLQVSALLLAFIGAAVFSALYAVLIKGVEPNQVLSELRPLLYYSAFFVTAWSIVRRGQIMFLLAGLLLLADVTGAVIIMQQFLGTEHPLLSAMTGGSWLVWRAGASPITFGTVRVIPPGHVLMMLMMVIAFCLMVYSRQRPLLRVVYGAHFLYLNIALLFTYTRAQWVASGVALALILILLPWPEKRQAGRLLGLLSMMVFGSYMLFQTELKDVETTPVVEALTERAGSLFTPSQTLETYSLQWRAFETEEALKSISQNPFLGVGLGNAYRDVTLLQGEATSLYYRFTRFVHNSYLYIAIKMGIAGLSLFMLLAFAFLARGWQVWRSTSDGQMKLLVLGVLASFIGILLWSVTQSHLLQTESTVVIGVMIGVVASIRQIEEPKETET